MERKIVRFISERSYQTNTDKPPFIELLEFPIPNFGRIGEVFVLNPINEKNGSRTLHGRGDIKAKDVIDVNLTLKPNSNPHPRHAEIVDWPSDPIAQQQAATDLVAVTTLHLLPDQSNAYP